MKRILLLTILTVSTFVMASAQTELPQVRAKKMVSKVNMAVALQGPEWGKVNSALVDYYTKFDALEKQKTTLGAAYNNQLAALKTTRDTAVKAALTADQATKYDVFIAKEKE